MKKLIYLAGFITVLFGQGIAMAEPVGKMEICHMPPGNTANMHTITVADSRLPEHVKHGDYLVSCDKIANTFCDDGDSCTQNIFNSETGVCENPAIDSCKPVSAVCPCAEVLEGFGMRQAFGTACNANDPGLLYTEIAMSEGGTVYQYFLRLDPNGADGNTCRVENFSGANLVSSTQMTTGEFGACRDLALGSTICFDSQ